MHKAHGPYPALYYNCSFPPKNTMCIMSEDCLNQPGLGLGFGRGEGLGAGLAPAVRRVSRQILDATSEEWVSLEHVCHAMASPNDGQHNMPEQPGGLLPRRNDHSLCMSYYHTWGRHSLSRCCGA